ncbi:nucleotidyltransferase domain-containing protein [Microcystis sp. M166S2]|uniref:nucleotidyltransferase domain-containing protein n=1 Tax=Microcystis sp. M166S2 TaxID=2771156 RepID=UPI00257AA11E|nr:nucleotidyltransferase domain-containing protein [Microcystis sp. M166S2]MCA2724431.1 nucleotidyltransferase domain-containing protein [Microcystis sp. M166S2]
MTNQQNILDRIKGIVFGTDPSAKVYLYGSRARGTTKPDSDWDLLILLNKDKITTEVERNVTSPLYDLEFAIGEVISPMIYSEKEWNSKHSVTPFYSNVMREGKLL